MDETTVQTAMAIILHAGDARLACKEALDAVADANFVLAKDKLKEAQKKITEAHKIQTDAIQGETRGETTEYSLLFTHAQDTLMTIYSEINLAKQLVKLFGVMDQRLTALEKGENKDE